MLGVKRAPIQQPIVFPGRLRRDSRLCHIPGLPRIVRQQMQGNRRSDRKTRQRQTNNSPRFHARPPLSRVLQRIALSFTAALVAFLLPEHDWARFLAAMLGGLPKECQRGPRPHAPPQNRLRPIKNLRPRPFREPYLLSGTFLPGALSTILEVCETLRLTFAAARRLALNRAGQRLGGNCEPEVRHRIE
jgi:hypothetical protein